MLISNISAFELNTAHVLGQTITLKQDSMGLFYNIDKEMYFETHNPAKDQNTLLRLEENFDVGREMWWHWGAMKKSDFKHTMGSPLANKIEKALEAVYIKPITKYNGLPLIDEYLNYMPMFWTLDKKHFTKTINYLKGHLSSINPTVKPLLIYTVVDGNATPEEKAFIEKYFTVPTDKDYETLMTFFAESKVYMRETTNRVESSKPSLVLGKDMRNYIFYDLQKFACEFNTNKIARLVIMGLAAYYWKNGHLPALPNGLQKVSSTLFNLLNKVKSN